MLNSNKAMRLRALSASSVLALAVLMPAMAQAQAASPAVKPSADAGTGEIMVTAQREKSLASKTPIALTALSADALRNGGIVNPTTLGEAVPNLSIDRANGGLQITIRGVTSTDNSEKGDPSAAFLLDSVYIARPQAQEVSFFDLNRVEVLRGPQGTLYGRNTTAGVVNVISALPKDRLEAIAEGTYGAFNTIQSTTVVNLPVTSMIAVRAAVNYDRRDSYVILGNPSPYTLSPYKDNISSRLSARFKFSDRATLVLRGDYSSIRGRITNFVPITNFFTNETALDPVPYNSDSTTQRTTINPEAQQTARHNNTWGVNAELNWDFGFVDMTYVGSYREFQRSELQSLNDGLNPGTFEGHYKQNSQELRLAFGKGMPLHGQVGGYYFREQSGIAFFIQNPQNFGFPADIKQFGFPQDPTISESYSPFGQITYDLSRRLHLTGGIRYSHDLKSRVGSTVADHVSGVRDKLQDNNAQRQYGKITWRAGIDYDAPGLGLIYGVVSTGYKAGGFNDGCLIGNGPICTRTESALYYDPETLTAYEAGFKLRLAGNAVRFNGAVFHYDYSGLQLTSVSNVCGAPCQVTTNAATAKVTGLELELVLEPSHRNHVDLSINLLDAHYSRFCPLGTDPVTEACVPPDFRDRRLDRAPRVTAAAGYTYTYPLGNGAQLSASGRIRLSDSYTLSDISVPSQFRQTSFHKSDVTLTYTAPGDRWFIQGFGKNLEDTITLSALDNPDAIIGDPRTYGVRAGVHF